jgi:DNA topoisomerase IA
VSEILKAGIQRPKKGHDAGDHPPITPMKAATEAELGHEAWRLYDYITRHFIATVSDLSVLCLYGFHFFVFIKHSVDHEYSVHLS